MWLPRSTTRNSCSCTRWCSAPASGCSGNPPGRSGCGSPVAYRPPPASCSSATSRNRADQAQLVSSRFVRGFSAGKVWGCPSQRVASRDGGAACTRHVQVWHEREGGKGKLLGSQVGVLADRGQEPVAE